MDFPSILSFGLGYFKGDFDLAVDYRFVDYENTNGFTEKGGDKTEGEILNPQNIQNNSPYGAITGSKVGYEMATSLVMIGVTFTITE